MAPDEALRDIQGYASAGRVVLVPHAWERLDERGLTAEDLRHALIEASSCTLQDNGRWKVAGRDLDGDDLAIVVSLESRVVVITVF